MIDIFFMVAWGMYIDVQNNICKITPINPNEFGTLWYILARVRVFIIKLYYIALDVA